MTDTPGVFSAPNGIGGEMGMVYGAPGARQVFEDQMIMGRVIDPRAVYPNDPDRGITIPQITQPPQQGGIPNLLQSNYLKPAGILSINKVYDI